MKKGVIEKKGKEIVGEIGRIGLEGVRQVSKGKVLDMEMEGQEKEKEEEEIKEM